MDINEIQAKATIAAALIISHAVEVPTMSRNGDWSTDAAVRRLRDLTDYVYQAITSGATVESAERRHAPVRSEQE